MSDEIDYAREVLEAAKPGPWTVGGGSRQDPRCHLFCPEGWPHADSLSPQDACAIALLGSTWREALAVIEEAAKAGSTVGYHPDSRRFYDMRLRSALDAWRVAVRVFRGNDE